MAKVASKTVKINGKEVPLTNKGLPNKVYLPKHLREVVNEYEKRTKGEATEKQKKDLMDILLKHKP